MSEYQSNDFVTRRNDPYASGGYDEDAPYRPDPNAGGENPGHRYDLRESTEATENSHEYDESKMFGDAPAFSMDEPNADKDVTRLIQGEVAASHRQDRSPEQRAKSAQKASDNYEQLTGSPLEIDKEGRVVEDK
ncbi:uncharacterized protein BYT42DRAFT_300883 [Radiomyces spectabilis]|uniref:uncharacterized protein n=1 Tax=Radiomyces spectabilis TaxID=64574 RepID=UPI00221ECB45|nr:uncharacterized protein BYT42DRAFT_300883 [Radiomyces spectabilis]KAI8381309.1 hypothetical protein BYT42DRAFT_300883 [Radiomyces spectabilis]